MNRWKLFTWKECLFLLGAAFFFFGCIATTHRSAKTLDPGQFSLSGSYLRAENLEEGDAEPVQLIALDSRFGLIRGLDMGFMHTWDVSKDNENMYATYWGDFKVQLTNRDNITGKPIFSLGLMKGHVYHEDAKYHITTFSPMLSIPIDEYVTPFMIYRHELIRQKKFLPDDFDDPRRMFVLGMEVNLLKPAPKRWIPKLGLSIGTYNSLDGGEGDDGLTLNFGLSIDSPQR